MHYARIILILSLMVSGLVHGQTADPMLAKIEGQWRLIGQRCDGPDGKTLYPIERYETGLQLRVIFESDTVTEMARLCPRSVMARAEFRVIAQDPWTIELTGAQSFPCEVDGVIFHSTRGLETTKFTYKFEGEKLIEDQGVCAQGRGRWKWIYVREQDLQS